MYCLGHVSMHAQYTQNNTQEQTKGRVGHEKHGDHSADGDVTLLKVQQELEIEIKTYLPSAQFLVAISCQTCQSYSILAYYPPASSRSAPFWDPDWQGARNCITAHQCGLGFVSCCLVPRFTGPKGRGRECSLKYTLWARFCDFTHHSWQASEMGIMNEELRLRNSAKEW